MEGELATKKDIEQLEHNIEQLAQAVNKGFNELQNNMRNEMHQDINGVRNGLREEINGVRNDVREIIEESKREILESNEKIAKEISDMRQEQIMHQGGHKRVDDTLLEHGDELRDHEKRISQLEPVSQRA